MLVCIQFFVLSGELVDIRHKIIIMSFFSTLFTLEPAAFASYLIIILTTISVRNGRALLQRPAHQGAAQLLRQQ